MVDAGATAGFNALRDQVKTYSGDFQASPLVTGMPASLTIST